MYRMNRAWSRFFRMAGYNAVPTMMFPEAEAEGFIGPLETERGKKSRVKRWFVQPSAGYRPLILKKKKKLLTIARERTYREEARPEPRFIGIPARFQAAGIIFQWNAETLFSCRWMIYRSIRFSIVLENCKFSSCYFMRL